MIVCDKTIVKKKKKKKIKNFHQVLYCLVLKNHNLLYLQKFTVYDHLEHPSTKKDRKCYNVDYSKIKK